MTAQSWILKNWVKLALTFAGVFFLLTAPFIFKRPFGGDRIGQTAGIIRIYCQEPSHSFLKGAHIHYGKNPFNLELTVFEWLQGALAHLIDGPQCDSVEVVAKAFAVLWATFGVLIIALLAAQIFKTVESNGSNPIAGPALAGVLASFLLAFDSLWLRYGTYTMIENRVLTIGMVAILMTLKRRTLAAFFFWVLTFVQKPQAFTFLAGFWGTLELVLAWSKVERSQNLLKEVFNDRKLRKTFLAFFAAALVGVSYYAWSEVLNRASDLPWIQWTGPRAQKWFFGEWSQRFTVVYWKCHFLEWLRRSGLNVAAPLFLILMFVDGKRFKHHANHLKLAVFLSLPLFFATLVYTFVFYPVYVVHEYYALPLNLGFALTTALVMTSLLKSSALTWPLDFSKRNRIATGLGLMTVLAVTVVALVQGVKTVQHYAWFTKEIDNKRSIHYLHDWDVQVFPKKNSFVVMAMLGNGRELFPLYFTKQRGFAWCVANPEFAPRKFWKEQGVEYVAWATGINLKTRRVDWLVRTIDEELRYARKMGWSSDINDVWSGRSMAEWASLGSRTGRDPCLRASDFDPRKW